MLITSSISVWDFLIAQISRLNSAKECQPHLLQPPQKGRWSCSQEMKVVVFTGDDADPQRGSGNTFVLPETWLFSTQLSNSSVCTYFCPSTYPKAHLHTEGVELVDVKWGFRSLGARSCQQQVEGWDPGWDPCARAQLQHWALHLLPLSLSPFLPSNLTPELWHFFNAEIWSILTSSLSLLTKKQDFSLRWFKTMNQLRKNL